MRAALQNNLFAGRRQAGGERVHGLGNQDVDFDGLGCDFLMAGCHKWLFGPRGTGIVAASDAGWAASIPTVPTFTDYSVWHAWLTGGAPEGRTAGRRMSPGGYKAFEHQWALAQAFEFHRAIGRDAIAARTADLAARLKDGLGGIRGVTVHTPADPALSAGIVSFDVDGWSPHHLVARLERDGIMASAAPYAVSHARLTPSIQNGGDDIDQVLSAIREIAH
jgi:isopenicillin-N epimerase